MDGNRAPQFPLHFGGGEIQGEKKMALLHALNPMSLTTNRKIRDILLRYGFNDLAGQIPDNTDRPTYPRVREVRQRITDTPSADVDAKYSEGADYRAGNRQMPAGHHNMITDARSMAGGGGGGGGGQSGGSGAGQQPDQ